MNYRENKIEKVVMMVVMILLVIAAVSAVFMLLWNWLIPDLFDGPALTFWHAAGLLMLVKIMSWMAGGRGKWKRNQSHWKEKWQSKCKHMSADEKEALKNKFMSKWCKQEHDQQ